MKKLATQKQVNGSHYKNKGIQPLEYILSNKLSYCLGNVVKYVTRNKEDKVQDLLKAKHYIDLELELVHGRDGEGNWLDPDTEERFPKTNVNITEV
tara:strand:+ start:1307 stop:1594 length:288 start_codon:yes stop_codon:yes gene_type:complete